MHGTLAPGMAGIFLVEEVFKFNNLAQSILTDSEVFGIPKLMGLCCI